MYAGCEFVGGPCNRSIGACAKMEGNVAGPAGGYSKLDNCNFGETFTELEGELPSFEQFTAQHKRADADSAVWAFMSAALQQSIAPIAPPIGHIFSPECIGMPATTLPPSTITSTRDVSRSLMVSTTLWKTLNRCQHPVDPRGTKATAVTDYRVLKYAPSAVSARCQLPKQSENSSLRQHWTQEKPKEGIENSYRNGNSEES